MQQARRSDHPHPAVDSEVRTRSDAADLGPAREPGTVLSQFETSVRTAGDMPAVRCETEELSYRDLNRQADELSHDLCTLGVGPDIPVGLCVDRSVATIVGLVAILKSGGAYVPLDPDLPEDRLRWMLEDSGAPVLVATPDAAVRLGALSTGYDGAAGRPIGCWAVREGTLVTDAEHIVAAEPPSAANLAYIIYTSGSTGRPKGVAIEHRNLASYTWAIRERLPFDQCRSFATASTIAADTGITSIYPSLCSGSCVHLITRRCAVDTLAWEEYFRRFEVDCLKIVASHLAALLGTGEVRAGMLPRRVLVVGGEACGWELIERIKAAAPDLQIFNHYGPTETTVGVTTYPLTAAAIAAGSRAATVPIGFALPNSKVVVLDQRLRRVAAGVDGEIYIGGAGVARGYWGRSDLTAERFVPIHAEADCAERAAHTPRDAGDEYRADISCPSVETAGWGEGRDGERFYRTGDRARYLPDGSIEFRGRLDFQVKIRGHRVEPGEVAAAVKQHPLVHDAVVIAQESAAGETRLVGYVAAAAGVEASAIRTYLLGRLPDALVPSAFVMLDSLPIAPNGKVDRQALPQLGEPACALARAAAPPRSRTELWLAQTWQRLLGVQSVGTQDSFFEIGGHSLMAAHLFELIHRDLGKGMSPATLFRAPTIELLAEAIDGEAISKWRCLVPIRAEGFRPPFYCVHGAAANVLYCEVLARHLPDDLPFYALQSLGLDGKAEPLTRIEDMAELYVSEVRAAQPEGPYYIGGYSTGGVIAFEMARRLVAAGDDVAILTMLNSGCPVASPHSPRRSWLVQRRLIPAMLSLELNMLLVQRRGVRHVARRQLALAWRRACKRLGRHGARKEDGLAAVRNRVWTLNLAAERKYRPQLYDGRVTLMYATQRDPDQFAMPDNRLAWSEFAGGGLEVHLVPGDHTTMRYPPHVTVLAARVDACLQRAQQERVAGNQSSRHTASGLCAVTSAPA